MTDTSFMWRRVSRRKTFQSKRRPHHLLVEELEGRVVPSYFPPTTNGIHIIEDQLPSGLSNARSVVISKVSYDTAIVPTSVPSRLYVAFQRTKSANALS
jgi:hypothetical protein